MEVLNESESDFNHAGLIPHDDRTIKNADPIGQILFIKSNVQCTILLYQLEMDMSYR